MILISLALERRHGDVALCFDCNLMHASNSDVSPHPRSDVFFVYSSVENKLRRPRGGLKLRPEFIAARQDTEPLQPPPLGYV